MHPAYADPPGISGSLVEGRICYDAFILENKAKATGSLFAGTLITDRPSIMAITPLIRSSLAISVSITISLHFFIKTYTSGVIENKAKAIYYQAQQTAMAKVASKA